MAAAGGLHAEIKIGDSMLMIGGGIPGRKMSATPNTTALHVYVEDTDAVYQRALAAGATSISGPADQEYGERSAGVKDPAGNYWYIATHQGPTYVPKGLNNVNVYMHPWRGEPVINFLKRAFGAEELGKYASPDGIIHHAEIRVGSSVVELGEAHGPYQPLPVDVLPLRSRLRRGLSARAEGWSHIDFRAHRPTLRRPQRRSERRLRQPVVHRDAHQRRGPGKE